jgi:hypothetical protein
MKPYCVFYWKQSGEGKERIIVKADTILEALEIASKITEASGGIDIRKLNRESLIYEQFSTI